MKKINKYFLIGLITPIILVSLSTYGVWSGIKYIEARDAVNFNDGVEVGRYIQLNEDFNTTTKDEQDKILKCLSMLESSGGKHRKILDTNNKYSLGLYHFQVDTVKDMYWRYFKQRISTERAIEIAQDDELSTELARVAIFQKKEKFHWFNSMNKLANAGIIK